MNNNLGITYGGGQLGDATIQGGSYLANEALHDR